MGNLAQSKEIAVYGATGYTGRLIARELVDMGHEVVLAGRSASALRELAAELGGAVDQVVVELDDDKGLHALLSRVRTIVNAAGSFVHTAVPVARAAVAANCHYVDISGEQHAIRSVFDDAGIAASDKGIALLPTSAYYATLADLLVSMAARGMPRVDDLDIAYRVRGWRPSGAALNNLIRGMSLPMIQFDGDFIEVVPELGTRSMDFGAGIGKHRVATYPAPEVLTIPRHLPVRQIRTAMTTSTFAPRSTERFAPHLMRAFGWGLRSPLAPFVENIVVTAMGGARVRTHDDPTRFDIVAHLRGGDIHRKATLSGAGIFDITGPIAARLAARTVEEDFTSTGPLAAAEVVDAQTFLDGLRDRGVGYHIESNSM